MNLRALTVQVALALAVGSGLAVASDRLGDHVSRDDVKRLRADSLERGRSSEPVMATAPRPMASQAESAGAEIDAQALGDFLVLSRDDSVVPKNWGAPPEYEGGIAPLAGGTDPRIAFRFETEFFVHEFPVDVVGVDIWLDNFYGFHVFPEVGFYGENPTNPLQPDLSLPKAVDSSGLDGTTQTPPVVPGVPDAFARYQVNIPFTVSEDLSIDDGSMSDKFNRADEVLQNPGSEWIECDELLPTNQCAASNPKRLSIVGNRVTKTLNGPGSALGVKAIPDPGVFQRRPVLSTDYAVSVDYDVSAPTAEEAGVATRVESYAGFYFAVMEKALGRIALIKKDAGGTETTMGTFQDPSVGNIGGIELRVVGTNPTTEISVYHDPDGSGGILPPVRVIGPIADGVERWNSPYVGIYSSTDFSFGEVWDNFQVRRNPDIFAVVDFPMAPNAKLPADLTPWTRFYDNVLVTADGTSWELHSAATACKPANGFARLRVADNSNDSRENVFQLEFSMRDIRTECVGCPRRTNLECGANQATGPFQGSKPVFEPGYPIDVFMRVWIDHARDLVLPVCTACPCRPRMAFEDPYPVFIVRTFEEPAVGSAPEFVLEGSCMRSGAQVHNDASLIYVPEGQNTLGGPAITAPCIQDMTGCIDEDVYSTFTPVSSGWHCIEVCEGWDDEHDCVVDSRPTADERPSTNCVARYINICDVAPFNLQVESLRMTAEGTGGCGPALLYAEWFPRSTPATQLYNVHELLGRPALIADRMAYATAPAYREPYQTGPVVAGIGHPMAPTACFASSATSPGIAYYGVWQSDCGVSGRDLP